MRPLALLLILLAIPACVLGAMLLAFAYGLWGLFWLAERMSCERTFS